MLNIILFRLGWWLQLAGPDISCSGKIFRGNAEVVLLEEKLSKTQVDRLGDRLRKGSPNEFDLRSLDHYRRSFGGAYAIVVRTLRKQLGLAPTGRPAKSTSSLIEKLQRESIRLSQVQDIAGCRLIVASVLQQDKVVESLKTIFSSAIVIDRRTNPSYGYRAVHVVVEIFGKLIEIQIRSFLQHLWAELSEKLSDVVDPSLKYGGGPKPTREMLLERSTLVADFESVEKKSVTHLAKDDLDEQERRERQGFQQQMDELKDKLVTHLRTRINRAENT